MGIHNRSRGGKLMTDGTFEDKMFGQSSVEEELELMHEIAIDDPN